MRWIKGSGVDSIISGHFGVRRGMLEMRTTIGSLVLSDGDLFGWKRFLFAIFHLENDASIMKYLLI